MIPPRAPHTPPNGFTLYRGPSLLDGSPIIVVAILHSGNAKTGDMVQTYILRADMDPMHASRTGADAAICGSCPMRGTPTDRPSGVAAGRGCYVTLYQGPTTVWNGFRAGRYPDAFDVAAVGAGRAVRLGTYGDPAAVPANVWRALTSRATTHTGYSHAFNTPGADAAPDLVMQSADSFEEAVQAWNSGRRTFRVVSHISDVRDAWEVLCPASAEAGRVATCATCRLCSGTSRDAKSVAIVAHGSGARNVPANASPQ